jgi:hypothetical protein
MDRSRMVIGEGRKEMEKMKGKDLRAREED